MDWPDHGIHFQQNDDSNIKGWTLDTVTIEAGLAQGAALDFDATVEVISNELTSRTGKTIWIGVGPVPIWLRQKGQRVSG